jgi:hypothetical protein
VKKRFPAEQEGGTDAWKREHDAELQELWQKLGCTGDHPWKRDQYKESGYSDDAMRITPEMLEWLESLEYMDVEVFDADERYEYTASDLDEQSVGDWLVVVDYHL